MCGGSREGARNCRREKGCFSACRDRSTACASTTALYCCVIASQVDGDADSEEEDEGMGDIDVEAPAGMVTV
jgi:hypothetical protein